MTSTVIPSGLNEGKTKTFSDYEDLLLPDLPLKETK